jgi:CelD/BcsL family acetyltransferase involved in cellulose biosynthesis
MDLESKMAIGVKVKTAPKVELLTSADSLFGLASEWDQLLYASAHPNIFLTWDWISTWWEVFGDGLQPWILVARDAISGRLDGVAPFVRRGIPVPRGPFRELSFFGNIVGAADHLDVLTCVGQEESLAAAFVDFLRRHRQEWDVLRLDGMSAESPLVALLRQRSDRPAMIWESVCPFLRLPDSRKEFLASFNRGMRANLRRRAGRLHEDTNGRVEYHQVTCADELPAALQTLFRLHQNRWGERGRQGAFADMAVRNFHQRLSERLLQSGGLRLNLLRANGQAIAAAYCFRCADTVSFYQTGYDPAWGQYSPGTAIMAHAICTAIEEGAREFDFLRGAERYKSEWTATARRDLRMRLATTTRGSALVLSYRAARAVRNRFRGWRRGPAGQNKPAANGDLFLSESTSH